MSSFTHESIINECRQTGKYLNKNKIKNKLSMMHLRDRLAELKFIKKGIEYHLIASGSRGTDPEIIELNEELDNTDSEIQNIQNQINELYEEECVYDNLTENVKNTISTTKLATLPSFQSRNAPTTKKILSDPYMLKNITSFNTGLGGKRRKYKSKTKSKKGMRKTRKTRKRTYIKA
jgi:CII-binding regulator of phage lambda lysogenization HflD